MTLALAPCFTARRHWVKNLALPVGDSRDRAAVELQVESSTAALEPELLWAPVALEPVVALRGAEDVGEVGVALPQPTINAAPATRTATCSHVRLAMNCAKRLSRRPSRSMGSCLV